MPKVLVADDDPDVLDICAEVLEMEGYTVDKARDGAEALRKLYADGVDAVVLDVMMPGVDGLTVCKTVRHDPELKQLPIIMMSASHTSILQARACSNAVLPKPFDLDRLISMVQLCIQAA